MFYASLTEVKLQKCAYSLLLFDIPSIGIGKPSTIAGYLSLCPPVKHIRFIKKKLQKHAHVTL